MSTSSRDRLSVDLRGLKAQLFDHAQALGVTPSDLVRTTLSEAFSYMERLHVDRSAPRLSVDNGARVRLSVRMSREHARATVEAARRAGLGPGDYVGGLVVNVPVLSGGGSRLDLVSALTASCAELSTLSRNIHRLTALLRQANVEPARAYREMLDRLASDVRSHLDLSARALADLQPRSRREGSALRSTS